MSHSVWSDVVPFIVHNVYNGDFRDLDDDVEEIYKLVSPKIWAEEHGTDQDEEDVESGSFSLRGWTLRPYKYTDDLEDFSFGKKKKLFGENWQKGKRLVFILNESEYSNGGDYSVSFVANDKKSLEVFLDDFADILPKSQYKGHMKIEKNDSAQQSG